jgi:glycerophosphoryl diester phosphodiesterase
MAWASHSLGGVGFGSIVRDLDAFQIPPSQGPIRFATEGFISRAKRHGVEVHFWTVNDPEHMRQLIALGADGIVSDRVDLFS